MAKGLTFGGGVADNRSMTYDLAHLPPSGRIRTLDRLRGLSLWLMLVFGAAKMATFGDFFAALSMHDVTKSFQIIAGYGFYDCIAPMFVFASGLAFWASYQSKLRRLGASRAALYGAKRGLELVGVGGLLIFNFDDPFNISLFALALVVLATWVVSLIRPDWVILKRLVHRTLLSLGVMLILINWIEMAVGIGSAGVSWGSWGPICSIGVGLLMALCLARLSTRGKVFASLLMTALYAGICLYGDPALAGSFVHGGLLGSLGYGLLVTYGFVWMSLAGKWRKVAYALAIGLLAIPTCLLQTPSKELVNLSFVLISWIIETFLYAFLALFERMELKYFPLFSILGRNSLTIYCLHFVTTFTFGICLNALTCYLPVGETLHTIVFALGLVVYPVLADCLVKWLSKKGWVVKL